MLLKLRSDEQLVALVRAGSDEAFCTIHDRYRVRLLAYVRRMMPSGAGDAEDVLQDVLMRALAALRTDQRPIVLRPWLYRIAHNRCIDVMRQPRALPTELPELLADERQDPTEQASRSEQLAQLVADLHRLPNAQRSALLLREIEGLSYDDIAIALSVTLPAVKSLLVRARMGLAASYEARETGCGEIRVELADACDQRRRTSAGARRHLRDCEGCRGYHDALRTTTRQLGALAPAVGPLAAIARLLGLGGSGAIGSGAIGGGAIGGGAIGGGGTAVVGGGAVAAATKVAVVVCCVAVTAGGSATIERAVQSATGARPAVHHAAPAATPVAQPTAAAAARIADGAALAPPAQRARPRVVRDIPVAVHLDRVPLLDVAPAPAPVVLDDAAAQEGGGGVAAPDELDERSADANGDDSTTHGTTPASSADPAAGSKGGAPSGTTETTAVKTPAAPTPAATPAPGTGAAPSSSPGAAVAPAATASTPAPAPVTSS